MKDNNAVFSSTLNTQISSPDGRTVAQIDITDDEKIDATARYILERYLPAFKELAK